MSGTIDFFPCPPDNFKQHISEYFERSREACPQIEAIYGKWRYEDLIPGLSDFDTRFLVSDNTAPSEWVHISREVGRVHTEICREYPDRVRILEHLPGINLTWGEAQNAGFYYPEFQQWTCYHGPDKKAGQFRDYLSGLEWSRADELFNVKKFALYFTPYDRNIDPAINLDDFENKYPMHSRFMHYFCPPVQCAVCLVEKRMVKGKKESLRLARELFPNKQVIDMIFDTIDRHYEIPEYYFEPKLSEIESELFDYLKEIYRIIQPSITIIDARPDDTSKKLREKLGKLKAGMLGGFYEGSKFCRLMMGRLLFYAEDIPYFDSKWLIENELKRIRRLFFETTFTAFGRIAWGEDMTPEDVLDRCRGEFLSEPEYEAVRAYADIFSEPYDPADIKKFASRVADAMGRFQVVLEKLGGEAKRLSEERNLT